MLREMTHLSKEKSLPAFFIGSMICPNGSEMSVLEYAINQARTKDQIHQPQLLQLGQRNTFNQYSMDGEALNAISSFLLRRMEKLHMI